MRPTFWNDERVEILKSRWAENWTASAIAGLIGCSRNAVIGKARRLGLPESIHRSGRPVATGAKIVKRTRAAASARGGNRTMRVRSAPLAPYQPLIELPVAKDEPVSRQIALADLKAGECGWIAGEDGCCCGHAIAQMFARGRRMASPYCAFHSARAYRVPQKKSA